MRDYIQFIYRNPAIICFGLLSVFFGNFGQSFFITWYSDEIQRSFSLTATYYGALYSIATLASGSCVMLLGGYIDRSSFVRYAGMVAVGLIAACLVLANAIGPFSLLVGFFLIRLFGQGLMPHTGITAMAKTFSSNRGKAISVATMGIPIGEVILPVFAVVLISSIGWQHSWYVIAASVVVIYLPGAVLSLRFFNRKVASASALQSDALTENIVKEPSPVENSAEVLLTDKGRRFVLKDFRFWLLLPSVIFGAFLVTGVFIHQGYFLTEQEWTREWFATAFIVYGLAHALSSLVTGTLIDTFSAKRLAIFITMPLAVAMAILLFFKGPWTAVAMLVCFAISIGMSGSVGSALWAELYGTAYLGAIRSLVTTFAVWMSALSPVIFGLFIDAGYDFRLLILVNLVLLIVTILMAFIGSRYVNKSSAATL